MITYIKQDIATIKRGVIAHGVNCRGVMGSGVAKSLRDAYPQVFTTYKQKCDVEAKHPDWMLGLIDIVIINGLVGEELLIVNCFTQDNYGRDNKVYADADAVRASLDKAIQLAAGLSLPFYMPKIGCGLGGLVWDDDIEAVVAGLSVKHNHDIFVCQL